MTEVFSIILHSPMGPRCGILRIQHCGTDLDGTIELLGKTSLIHGTMPSPGQIQFSCILHSAVREIPCRFSLLLTETQQLSGIVSTSFGRIHLTGQKQIGRDIFPKE